MTCLQEQSRLSMQQEQERSRSLLVSSLQQEVGKWEGLLQEKEGHLTAALEEEQAKAMEKTEQAIKEVCAGGEGRADGVLVSWCSMIHRSQSLHSLTHRTCTVLLPSPPLPSLPCLLYPTVARKGVDEIRGGHCREQQEAREGTSGGLRGA